MDLFLEGGFVMPFITLFGLVAFVAAILHAAFARRWSFILGIANVPVPMLIGVAGWVYGRMMVAEAIAWGGGFAPEIAEVGYAEARIPLIFGAMVFFVCLIPFAVGIARQVRCLTPR